MSGPGEAYAASCSQEELGYPSGMTAGAERFLVAVAANVLSGLLNDASMIGKHLVVLYVLHPGGMAIRAVRLRVAG